MNALDKRLLLTESDLRRLERRLDEILGRRWDLWKLVLAAFLGGLITLATQFIGEVGLQTIESGWLQNTSQE